MSQTAERPPASSRRGEEAKKPIAPLAETVGHTRFVVLVGVAAVLLIASALFLFGAGLAVWSIWHTAQQVVQGQANTSQLTVQYLEIVSTMLKAVVFYLVGVGLYSLFIAPLNLPVALGVETFNDLESKIVSIVIVIMAITFLEHFIQWQQPLEVLQFGAAFALVGAVLVLFQLHAHRSKEDLVQNSPMVEERAHVELFSEGRERRDVRRGDFDEATDGQATEEEPARGRRARGE